MTNRTVTFNGNDLSDIAMVAIYNNESYATRDLKSYQVARADFTVTGSAFYTDKTITVDMFIRKCTREDAEKVVSRLLMVTQGEEGDLQFTKSVYNGSSDTELVTYKRSTLKSIPTIDYKGGTALVQLSFFVGDPICYGNSRDLFASTNKTTAVTVIPISPNGTFTRMLPTITGVVGSITAGDSPSLSVSDGIRTATYSGSVASNFSVNSTTKRFMVDGVSVAYSGSCPMISYDTSNITVTDGYTARNMTITGSYQPRWI